MIVLDASAVVELVLGTSAGRRVADRIADPAVGLHVPHLIDIEFVQALRRLVRDREIDAEEAAAALEHFRALDLQRHAHEPYLDRVWALRQNLSAYDAIYVALAEVLDGALVTCDARLARSPGVGDRAELVAGP